MKKEDRIEALKYAIENQIGWQKYGEAKNVVLFTISGTTVFTIVTLLITESEKINKFPDVKTWLLISLVICSFSLIIALISMFVNLFQATKFKDEEESNILLVNWHYVKNRKLKDLKKIEKEYSLDDQILDLLIQQKVGSEITYLKYRFFNSGIIVYAIGALALLITTTIFLI